MAKFRFYEKKEVVLEIDERALDYYNTSSLGEGISYLLEGRENWKKMVLALYDHHLDATLARNYVAVLMNALEDILYFEKIFTK